MQEIRCPDCGFRLKTNECPICCKRVPFPVAAKQKTAYKRPQRNIEVSFPQTGTGRKKRTNSNPKVRIISAVVAVVLAVFPLISEILDDIQIAAPEPDYPAYYDAYYDAYLEAGAAGAEHIPAMESQIIYEDHGILIEMDSFGLLYDDPAMYLTISNTSEQNVTVSTEFVVVNGYMMGYSGLYCETPAGETVQTFLRLDWEDLSDAGIDTVADIILCLDLYDSDDYSDVAANVQIALETEAAGLVQNVDDSGTLVYEADGVRLIFKDVQVDDYGDATLRFFAENLTDHPVNIGADMIYLNDQETDGMLWCHLQPNTRSVDPVYIFDLSEYKIEKTEDIDRIRLELYIENAENWETAYQTAVIDTSH